MTRVNEYLSLPFLWDNDNITFLKRYLALYTETINVKQLLKE